MAVTLPEADAALLGAHYGEKLGQHPETQLREG